MFPDFDKASLETPALLRVVVAAIVLALIGADLLTAPVSADSTVWSDSGGGEAVFVQACPGFDITTSYTANRTFKVISNSTGDQVVERLYVGFVGTLANDTTGQTLPYDGRFTRISDYHRNSVTIKDLELRFDADTLGQFAVAIKHVELDLVPDPVAVITTFASKALQMELCDQLGGVIAPEPTVASYEERLFSGPSVESSVASYEERMFSGLLTNEAGDMTPWTILDPCDTSPPGKNC